MNFHTAIWVDNYTDYVAFLLELETFSTGRDYLPHEHLDYFAGLEAQID